MVELVSGLNRDSHYFDLQSSSRDFLVYQSPKFLSFLSAALGMESMGLAHFDHAGRMVGAIPFFVKEVSGIGKVMNSLPWFGSHGAPLIRDCQDRDAILSQLFLKLNEFLQEQQVDFATVICNPKSSEEINRTVARLGMRHAIDHRTGQWTDISQASDELKLMDRFHSKTRNMIRKAKKESFVFGIDQGLAAKEFLIDTHFENMAAIGGRPKLKSHFYSLFENMEGDYEIWTAKFHGTYASALLLLKHAKIVEYFIPVIKHEYRASQCLSGLIFSAMSDLSKRGFDSWNWGGTWKDQESLYRFKSRWGAEDVGYSYFTFYGNEMPSKTKLNLFLENFPFFFVFPNRDIK